MPRHQLWSRLLLRCPRRVTRARSASRKQDCLRSSVKWLDKAEPLSGRWLLTKGLGPGTRAGCVCCQVVTVRDYRWCVEQVCPRSWGFALVTLPMGSHTHTLTIAGERRALLCTITTQMTAPLPAPAAPCPGCSLQGPPALLPRRRGQAKRDPIGKPGSWALEVRKVSLPLRERSPRA